VNTKLWLLIFGFFFLSFSACGSKVSSVNDNGCYEIDGDNIVYTCDNNKNAEINKTSTGYDGPNNPKALNLYRPGRFENINSPVW
jgi:hypothetical protein